MHRIVTCSLSILLLLGALLSSRSAQAAGSDATPPIESPAPDTPVGRQLTWILDVLDGTTELTTADVAAHFGPDFLVSLSAEQAVAGTRQFAATYGPVRLTRFVRPVTDTQAVGLIETRTGDALLIVVAVEHDEPHRISALTLQPAPPSLMMQNGDTSGFGGLIDIGGRRLYLACMGPSIDAGGPTVVLEAGHGNNSTVWLAVQAALAPEIRVCAYDRANAPGGASDPSATPRTGDDVVDDLHALLKTAGVPGPVVLVGHSLGGLFVRLYASQHPEEMAGLVLVDPSHEDQETRIRELVGPDLWAAREAVSAGFVDPEGFDLKAIAVEVRAAKAEAPLPPMPLVVLTHGLPPDAALIPSGWPLNAEERLWRELHADLAGLVPGGRQVIAERSGHFIQIDQPDLVTAAIRDVLAAGRDLSPPGTPRRGNG